MSIPERLSSHNRARKLAMFINAVNAGPDTAILDVGFSEEEYHATDNFLEKHYPYQERITALGIDVADKFLRRYPKVRAVTYDGMVFPFSSLEFDACWSNAVIEHVGEEDDQVQVLKEIRRTARFAFIATPNRHFPIEMHTRTPLLHLLPKRWFDGYLRRIGKDWAAGSYMNLLSYKDVVRLLDLAGIEEYTITRNKMCGITFEFIITFGEVEKG